MSTKERPVISDLPRTRVELACEVIAGAALLFAWAVALLAWSDLPQRIPMHFDFSGQPDAWGSKGMLVVLPIILLVLYALLTLLARVPHVYNYPVAITPENARTQYRLARSLITEMKAVTSLALAYLTWGVIAVARGAREDLGEWFLLALLLALAVRMVRYLIAAHRAAT